jgi:hypothetical protein
MDSSRDQIYLKFLREARELAQQDSENFDTLIQAFERIGAMEGRRIARGLGEYRDGLLGIAKRSPLGCEIPRKWPHLHIDADTLFGLIKTQRNDAMHQGIVARNLVRHSVEFSLILEHALSNNMNTASELMVRDICYAELGQPISYIRQRMLVNAFSYLPVRANGTVEMLSDVALAKWLRQMDWEEEAKALAQTLAATCMPPSELAQTLADARMPPSKLALTPATVLSADTPVNKLVEKLFAETNHAPVLLHGPNGKGDIVGLISAFDLL